jgi:hypothetical protein
LFGWHATSKNAGFLVPMTLINLTSIAMLLITMGYGTYLPHFNYTDPQILLWHFLPLGRPRAFGENIDMDALDD